MGFSTLTTSCMPEKTDLSCRRRAGAAGQQPFDQGSLSSKAARRRFMSGKAADIHHQSTAASQQQQVRQKQQQQRQQRRSDQPLNRDDFLNMQKEVQQVGKLTRSCCCCCCCCCCCPSLMIQDAMRGSCSTQAVQLSCRLNIVHWCDSQLSYIRV